jgi:hypothetical protein
VEYANSTDGGEGEGQRGGVVLASSVCAFDPIHARGTDPLIRGLVRQCLFAPIWGRSACISPTRQDPKIYVPVSIDTITGNPIQLTGINRFSSPISLQVSPKGASLWAVSGGREMARSKATFIISFVQQD